MIGGWLASLPPFFAQDAPQKPKFRLCHSILRWRYRNFRILMFRPFLVSRLMIRPSEGIQDNDPYVDVAVQRCLDAARESVDLICTFWIEDSKNMMACWYGLYFLFQAILIPVICLRNDPQSPLVVSWRDQISKAMPVLESMGQLNPTALRCLGVIRSLCGTYLDPSMDGLGRPTEESPQTQLASLYPLMWPTLEMAQLDGVDSILYVFCPLDTVAIANALQTRIDDYGFYESIAGSRMIMRDCTSSQSITALRQCISTVNNKIRTGHIARSIGCTEHISL